MGSYARDYFMEMKNDVEKDLRVRLPEAIRTRLIEAFNESRVSQVEGVKGLAEFYINLDDVGRAILLGQIKPNAEDMADLLLRRLHRREKEIGTKAAEHALLNLKNATEDKGASGGKSSRHRSGN